MNANRPQGRIRRRGAVLALLLMTGPVAAPTVAVLASVAADARPGGGGSMGSRGSRTYMAPPPTATNPGGATPFGRSLTPRPGYGQYGNGYNGGFGGGGLQLGHGFFGNGGYGYGGGGLGMGSLIGLVIQLAIVFFVVRWLWRRFSGGRAMTPAVGGPGSGAGKLAITQADYQQFEQGLLDVQQAWSMQDMRSLSRFATPEMVSYFSEQLSDLASRNQRNVVSAVRMEQGDVSEAWSENGRDFATLAMRYSLIDVTTDLSGRVVDGSPNERQMVTELWTFVRARGGNWLLSAIQQAR